MRPVSERFTRAVRGSHRMCARARVCPPGQTGVDPDGTEIPIRDGEVETDSTADVRGTAEVTTDGNRWSFDVGGLLTPYGNELFVERGIVYGNGDTEWVSQGYFRIYSAEQNEAPNGVVQLAGRDRMAGIVDARPLAPQEFGANTSVEAIVDYLVRDVYPDAEIVFDFDASARTFPSTHVLEDDRYAFLLDIATSLGKVMYFDHEGRLRVETAPNPDEPVFDVNAGEDGVLTALARGLNRDGVYNAVVARGEQVGEQYPSSAVALDLNPASPTYWLGPFGKVPRFYASSFLTTDQQCQSAADAMLTRSIGLPHTMDLSAVPNPALEALDPVRVGDEGVHVLESVTLSLVADDAMDATTKLKITGGAQ